MPQYTRHAPRRLLAPSLWQQCPLVACTAKAATPQALHRGLRQSSPHSWTSNPWRSQSRSTTQGGQGDRGTGHKRQEACYRYGKDLISYAAPYATAITSSQLQHSLQPAP